MPNKLSRFWQELRRRKVVRVITVYAATAFIIMEAADIMFPRLGLPEWTVTLVIVLLIAGFPITVILSWIFDVTPEGIRKSDPLNAVSKEKVSSSASGKIFNLHNAVITVLLVVVCILLYPKIFRADKFSEIRDEEGRISLAVMPFINLTQDTLLDVWQQGIQKLLINSLSNSEELAVRQPESMFGLFVQEGKEEFASLVPGMGSDVARRLEASTFIEGTILKAGNSLRVSAQMRNTGTEEVFRTFEINGRGENDLLIMSDSLSSLIRNYLEIKVLERRTDPDVHSYPRTHSAQAYKNYILGYNRFMKEEYQAAEMYLQDALEIDSTLLNAKIFLGWVNRNQGRIEQAHTIWRELYSQVEQYDYLDRLAVEFVNPDNHDPYAKIWNREQVLEYDPNQRVVWFQLGASYQNVGMYEKAIEAYENSLRVNEELGGDWNWLYVYCWLGDSYHLIGNHERENLVLEMAFNYFPDDPYIIWRQAVCAISRNDTTRGSGLVSKYRKMQRERGTSLQEIEARIGWLYESAGFNDKAKRHYQLAMNAGPLNDYAVWAMNDLAYLLCESDEHIQEALVLIDHALEYSPGDEELLAEMYHTKGWIEHKLGNYAEAVVLLNRSIDLIVYDQTLTLHLQEAEQALSSQQAAQKQ